MISEAILSESLSQVRLLSIIRILMYLEDYDLRASDFIPVIIYNWDNNRYCSAAEIIIISKGYSLRASEFIPAPPPRSL